MAAHPCLLRSPHRIQNHGARQAEAGPTIIGGAVSRISRRDLARSTCCQSGAAVRLLWADSEPPTFPFRGPVANVAGPRWSALPTPHAFCAVAQTGLFTHTASRAGLLGQPGVEVLPGLPGPSCKRRSLLGPHKPPPGATGGETKGIRNRRNRPSRRNENPVWQTQVGAGRAPTMADQQRDASGCTETVLRDPLLHQHQRRGGKRAPPSGGLAASRAACDGRGMLACLVVA